MSSSLTVSDNLLNALRRQAQTRELSWEQWALMILADAADPRSESSWDSLNHRRLDLIHQKYDGGLNECEER